MHQRFAKLLYQRARDARRMLRDYPFGSRTWLSLEGLSLGASSSEPSTEMELASLGGTQPFDPVRRSFGGKVLVWGIAC